jgi:hypothetical protein
MPEWLAAVLTFGAGILGGVAIAFASTAFSVWLQERRDRRSRGRQLLAKLHSLFEDAEPYPILYVASLDQERAERAGRELWRRWREELREPLRIFAFESSEAVQRYAKETATHIALSIQMTRNAIDAADDPETRAAAKTAAEEAYKVAQACIDDLDRAFEGRELSRALDADRRRSG